MSELVLFSMVLVGQPVEIPAFEITAIQRRQGINSGHMEISLETTFLSKTKGEVNQSSLLRVWFDDENKRCDDIDRITKVRKIKSFQVADQIVWSDFGAEGPQVSVTVFKPTTDGRWPRNIENLRPVHPRLLGMVPSTYRNLRNYALDALVASPLRTDATTSEEDLNGIPCVVTRFTRFKTTKMAMWFARDMDYSVVRIELRDEPAGAHDTLETEYEKHAATGIWFPREFHYLSYRSGQRDREERGEIRVIQLNEPVDESVFTLAGLDLPVGKQVAMVTVESNETRFWDGRKLVSDGLTSAPEEQDDALRWWLSVVAIILLLLAALLIVTRRRNPS